MTDFMQEYLVVRADAGPRFAYEGSRGKTLVTVATGYDAIGDRWPYHVYVKARSGKSVKLEIENAFADTQGKAVLAGFEFLHQWFQAHPEK